jgi:hypothetical protein
MDINLLKIVLHTNVPSTKELELTSDMIIFDEKDKPIKSLSKYPYFSNDMIYPDMKSMLYSNAVSIFFDENLFENHMKRGFVSNGGSISLEKRNENSKTNIMKMLDVLFPTGFPVVGFLLESSKILLGTSSMTFFYNPLSQYLNPFTKYYSHLKVGGNVYSVMRVVWMNDIFNHPKYSNLIDKYNELKNYISRKVETLELKFKDSRKKGSDDKEMKLKEYCENTKNANKIEQRCKEFLYFSKIFDEIKKDTSSINDENYNIFISTIRNSFTSPYMESMNTTLQNYLNYLVIKKGDFDDYDKYMKNITEGELKNYINFEKIGNDVEKLVFLKKINNLDEYSNVYSLDTKKYIFNNNNDLNNDDFMKEILNIFLQMANKAEINKFLNHSNKLSDRNRDTKYKEFFDKFNETMDKYIIKGKQKLELETNQTNFKKFFEIMEKVAKIKYENANLINDEDVSKILNVSVCKINETSSSNDTPKREIHLLVDFIEGQIDNSIINKIFCPYFGEHLGNEFDRLMTNEYVKIWQMLPFDREVIPLNKIMEKNREEKEDNKKNAKKFEGDNKLKREDNSSSGFFGKDGASDDNRDYEKINSMDIKKKGNEIDPDTLTSFFNRDVLKYSSDEIKKIEELIEQQNSKGSGFIEPKLIIQNRNEIIQYIIRNIKAKNYKSDTYEVKMDTSDIYKLLIELYKNRGKLYETIKGKDNQRIKDDMINSIHSMINNYKTLIGANIRSIVSLDRVEVRNKDELVKRFEFENKIKEIFVYILETFFIRYCDKEEYERDVKKKKEEEAEEEEEARKKKAAKGGGIKNSKYKYTRNFTRNSRKTSRKKKYNGIV